MVFTLVSVYGVNTVKYNHGGPEVYLHYFPTGAQEYLNGCGNHTHTNVVIFTVT